MGDSHHVDYVFGLTKKQLIVEILRLKFQVQNLRNENLNLESSNKELAAALTEIMEKNEERFDDLLEQNREIVNLRLGLKHAPREKSDEPLKPLRRGLNWNKTKMDFESRKKEEYWKIKIAASEARQTSAMNQSANEAEKTDKES